MKDKIELSKEEWNERVNGGTKEETMRKFKPTKEQRKDRKASIYILVASAIVTFLIMYLFY